MLMAQKDSLKCRCKEERDIPSEVKGLVIQGGDTMMRKSGMFRDPIVASISIICNLLYNEMLSLICGDKHD